MEELEGDALGWVAHSMIDVSSHADFAAQNTNGSSVAQSRYQHHPIMKIAEGATAASTARHDRSVRNTTMSTATTAIHPLGRLAVATAASDTRHGPRPWPANTSAHARPAR